MLDIDLPALGRHHSYYDSYNFIVLLAQQGRNRRCQHFTLYQGQQREERTLIYLH